MSIQIDKEFKELIPPLSADEYSLLEENILKEGIRDPLVVWSTPSGDILIDGHNRWEISAKHAGIRFETVKKEFKDREDVKEWIIRNQLGRRNIPLYVRGELALRLKPVIAERAEKNLHQGNEPLQKSVNPVNTQKELAKAVGVSHDTIHKVEKIQEKASDEAKEALRRGETSINAVYSGIMAAENENKRQKEARELREAKKRVEEYEDQKTEGIVELGAVRQHKEDQELIAGDFLEDYQKMVQHVRRFGAMIPDGRLENALRGANHFDQVQAMNQAQECMRTFLRIQRVIAEVLE